MWEVGEVGEVGEGEQPRRIGGEEQAVVQLVVRSRRKGGTMEVMASGMRSALRTAARVAEPTWTGEASSEGAEGGVEEA